MRSTECSLRGVWVAKVPHPSEWTNFPHVTLLNDTLSKERARLRQRPGTQKAPVCLGFNSFFVLFCFLLLLEIWKVPGDFSDSVSLSGLCVAHFL